MSISFEGEGLLRQSLSLLHSCGRERDECVVLWLGARGTSNTVTRAVHPAHSSHHGGYQIADGWLSGLWKELADRDERIVAQVHTHPRCAFHSKTDDRFPVVWKPGLYSLVIPNFARPPIREEDWYLTRLQDGGTWSQVDWEVTPQ